MIRSRRWTAVTVARDVFAVLIALPALAPPAAAQQTAGKLIRFIVPYAPGGGADIVARMIGQKLGEAIGQPVVIENRPGAGGNIGAEAAAKLPPNGSAIMLATNTLAINASLYRNPGYDLEKDFAPIMLVSTTPLVLVVHPSLPAYSVKQFVALAKSRPDELHYSSAGNGSTAHLAGQMLNSTAGIRLVHVPYKGTAQGITDLLSGQVQLSFPGLSAVLPQINAGRLRALAVTSANRAGAMPDLPTIAGSGFPGYEAIIWNGVMAPAGTPRDVIMKLNAGLLPIMGSADIKERSANQGIQAVSGTPEEFAAYVKADIARWRKAVRESGVRID